MGAGVLGPYPIVFPACAGVSLDDCVHRIVKVCFPRVCGGEPPPVSCF